MKTKSRTARSVSLGRRVRGGADMPCAFPNPRIPLYCISAPAVCRCQPRGTTAGETAGVG